jgi:hypothetical protein
MGKDVKVQHQVPTLINDRKNFETVDEKAEILSSAFILPDPDTPEKKNTFLKDLAMTQQNEIVITPKDVSLSYSKLKSKSCIGDQIPSRVLKNTLCSLLVPLSLLFNTIFRTGEYPDRFKNMYVLPIYKGKGVKSDPNSYRPISSVSTLSKLFEHVLKRLVMKHVEDSELLDDNQHGFRSRRSCQTALMSFTQRIFNELDKPNHLVVVVFIDLRKAFDSVVHLILLRKIKDVFNVPRNLLIVTGNYLFNRYYYFNGVFVF